MLSEGEVRRFAEDGWIVVPDLVGGEILDALDDEVDQLVSAAPPPPGHVGHHFYWLTSAEHPVLFAPLEAADGILAAAGDLLGGDRVEVAFDQAQVALNIPPYSHRPGRPHIDGYAPGQQTPGTFTLLAGLLLSDQATDNGGNLWVWPGTHLVHAEYFGASGPEGFAAAGGYPDIELPEPTQVRGRRGDVLLAHYLLGHNIGGNDESDRTRRAIYWRLRAEGHEARWDKCLCDPWLEYAGVRRTIGW